MWIYLVVIAVLAFGVYAFVSLVRGRARHLSSKTNLTAEDLYDRFGDEPVRPAGPHGTENTGAGRGAE